jgi:hypothetical protein
MASVSVDSGQIEATDFLRSVPREKWRSLMNLRKYFLAVNLTHDCSCLVQFVDDAKLMYAELGFASADEMVRNGYELEPEEIRLAVDWLRLNPPAHPLPLETAKRYAQHGGARKGAGRPKANVKLEVSSLDCERQVPTALEAQRSLASTAQSQDTVIKNQVRNTRLKGDGSIERTLARLDRDGFIDLAAQVRAGEISANAAAIKAGFRKRRRCPHCGHEL